MKQKFILCLLVGLISFIADAQIKFDIEVSSGYTYWGWGEKFEFTNEIGGDIKEGRINGSGLNIQALFSVLKPMNDRLSIGAQFGYQKILFNELKPPNSSTEILFATRNPSYYKYGFLIDYKIIDKGIKLAPQLVFGGVHGNNVYINDGKYRHGYHANLGVKFGIPLKDIEFFVCPRYTFQSFGVGYDDLVEYQIQHNINLGLGIRF